MALGSWCGANLRAFDAAVGDPAAMLAIPTSRPASARILFMVPPPGFVSFRPRVWVRPTHGSMDRRWASDGIGRRVSWDRHVTLDPPFKSSPRGRARSITYPNLGLASPAN